MLIVVRHAEEEASSECTYAHDAKITPKGMNEAFQLGNTLLRKYGLPDYIFVSPFRRTITTLDNMLSKVKYEDKKKIQVFKEINLGRYFSKSQQNFPDTHPDTHVGGLLHTTEDKEHFKNRTHRIIKKIHNIAKSGKVVWVITHVVVFKRFAKFYNIEIQPYVDFLDNIILKV
jgi:broad specificity phosphatase PhoE